MRACHITSASDVELTCLPMRPCQQAHLREHTLLLGRTVHDNWPKGSLFIPAGGQL